MRRPFATTVDRVLGLAQWQLFLGRVIGAERPDIIQFCDVFSAVPALVAKYATGARLIFDIRDNAGLSVRHRSVLAAYLLDALERFAAVASDSVVTVSIPLKETLPPAAQRHTIVIPNAPLGDTFDKFQFSGNGELRVNLAGFVSHRRNLVAWCRLSSDRPTVHLDLYGNVADDQTRCILRDYGVTGIESCPHPESIRRMSLADVVSLMYDPAVPINVYAAPNKYYEALMLGKPIVAAKGMKLAREIVEHDCGVEVDYGDVGALRNAMDRFTDLGVRQRMGMHARQLFEERYLGAVEHAMDTLYVDVLPGGDEGTTAHRFSLGHA
jgi:glycosyltransferase involved in cell wall biosynthesis